MGNLLTIRQPANHETETQLSQSLQNVNFPTGQTTQYSCEKPALICRLFSEYYRTVECTIGNWIYVSGRIWLLLRQLDDESTEWFSDYSTNKEVIILVDRKYERARACPSGLGSVSSKTGSRPGSTNLQGFVAGSNAFETWWHTSINQISSFGETDESI